MRALIASCLVVCAGCASAPPLGFDLRVRFMEIAPSAVETLTIHFEPRDGMFMSGAPQTFENGAINVAPQADGTLLMTVSAGYVIANTTPATGGSVGGTLDLHIWSDDPTMNMGPLLQGSVTRTSQVIGSGSAYLPEWPPTTGNSAQLPIMCTITPPSACM